MFFLPRSGATPRTQKSEAPKIKTKYNERKISIRKRFLTGRTKSILGGGLSIPTRLTVRFKS